MKAENGEEGWMPYKRNIYYDTGIEKTTTALKKALMYSVENAPTLWWRFQCCFSMVFV
ncbi:MAG: hypothetical protein LBT00_16010 [Spirochaetaceae bacterium]|nr:hypothetical protein [Spirochaetaceae bacterium]